MNGALGVLATCLLGLALLGTSAPLQGRFALQSGDVKTHGYLGVTPLEREPLARRLDVWFTGAGADAQPIRHYDLDMTKYLHLVVVSDDLRTFLHLHPTLSGDGHFRLDQRFPRATTYHLYADGEPARLGQQVFRYDLALGAPHASSVRALAPAGNVVRAGPYTVALDRTSVRAGRQSAIVIHVRERNAAAKTLHPYLGAPAHAVFINVHDLTYVHVHPMPLGSGRDDATSMASSMDMSDPSTRATTVSPDMMLHVAVREAGTYRLWLEFRGTRGVYVAAFVVTAT
jgi:hypothetical protein